jgi:hypothetical protein
MKIKKSWKPLINIVGLILIVMMTAASVSAEDPITRDNPLPDEAATTDSADDTESGDEPILIAPSGTEENATNNLPDYQNYTGDMLISPGPEVNAEEKTSLYFSILGVIGAVVVIALVIIGITLKRKEKK